MHNIKSNFDKILRVLRETLGEDSGIFENRVKPGPKTKFTDIEIVALACTAEYMGYDSENYLFSIIDKKDFPNLLSRRQYNDRKKVLLRKFEGVRRQVMLKIKPSVSDAFVVDSMPLKVCRIARMFRNSIGKDGSFGFADVGFCAAQQERYFGFKLHATCTLDGVLATIDFTPASVHDVHYLKDIKHNFQNCTIIGDKGYISQQYKTELKEYSNITLLTDARKNQKTVDFIPKQYKGKRKKIETIFSQLTDQFNIQKNYSKSACGYFSRLMSKITSMTIMNYINQHVNKISVSRVKYALAG
jgi:hypothetical protein